MSNKYMQIVRLSLAPLAGATAGTIFGVTARYVIGSQSSIYGALSLSFLALSPPILGLLTVALATQEQKQSYAYAIVMPWVAATLCCGFAVAFAWEFLFCIVLILPYLFIASSVGGLIAKLIWHAFKSIQSRLTAVVILSVLPYVFVPVERMLPLENVNRTVHSQITINAPPDVVWRHITNLEPIVGDEQQEAFFHVIGLPRPLDAKMVCEEVGCVRHGQWEDGLSFNGTITQFEVGQSYWVSLVADTNDVHSSTAPLEAVGGPVFGMVDDGYEIETTADGQTILHLYSTYRIQSRINPYAVLWLDLLMRDIQGYILNIEKARAEADAHN